MALHTQEKVPGSKQFSASELGSARANRWQQAAEMLQGINHAVAIGSTDRVVAGGKRGFRGRVGCSCEEDEESNKTDENEAILWLLQHFGNR